MTLYFVYIVDSLKMNTEPVAVQLIPEAGLSNAYSFAKSHSIVVFLQLITAHSKVLQCASGESPRTISNSKITEQKNKTLKNKTK